MAARAAVLNQQMAAVSAYPRLTDHNGEGWHLHYRDTDDDLPVVLSSVFAVGTALHLTTRGITRLGRCASTPCVNVIVDISRNGTQRYCSPRCASRDAVRRHRARNPAILATFAGRDERAPGDEAERALRAARQEREAHLVNRAAAR